MNGWADKKHDKQRPPEEVAGDKIIVAEKNLFGMIEMY